MHWRYSSTRLTVAPLTVIFGLRCDGWRRRYSRYSSTIRRWISIKLRSPKNCRRCFENIPVVSLTIHGQSRAVRGTKLVAQFRERHPLARPTNFEQTQRDFAVSLFPDFCGDFLAGSLGRLKPAFISHREAHPPEPRSFSSVQPHLALLLLARGVRRRDYTCGGGTTASR